MRLTPPSSTTCTGGGASAALSCLSPPQPLHIPRLRAAAMTAVCFINKPHHPMKGSARFRGKALPDRYELFACCLEQLDGAEDGIGAHVIQRTLSVADRPPTRTTVRT